MRLVSRTIAVQDLGRTRYRDALATMRALHAERKAGACDDMLLLTEHEPVITIGRGADLTHLLAPEAELARRGIDFARVERGGDITYHGPGQLVAYPILDLYGFGRDAHRYVRQLEECARLLLAAYGVDAERRPGAPGLYVGTDKIASVGVFISHWVTMHGVAINLDPDPEQMALIRPCGLAGVALASVARLAGDAPSYEAASALFAAIFSEVFAARVCYPLASTVSERE